MFNFKICVCAEVCGMRPSNHCMAITGFVANISKYFPWTEWQPTCATGLVVVCANYYAVRMHYNGANDYYKWFLCDMSRHHVKFYSFACRSWNMRPKIHNCFSIGAFEKNQRLPQWTNQNKATRLDVYNTNYNQMSGHFSFIFFFHMHSVHSWYVSVQMHMRHGDGNASGTSIIIIIKMSGRLNFDLFYVLITSCVTCRNLDMKAETKHARARITIIQCIISFYVNIFSSVNRKPLLALIKKTVRAVCDCCFFSLSIPLCLDSFHWTSIHSNA